MRRHVVRLAAATLAVAAAGVVVSPPAQAATCSPGSGVSVVVDFHQLGGGVQTFCDTGGAGEDAATQFEDAGHTLTYVAGEPFVCQVDGKPESQCARTPPANAYWSLWWSDGKSGEWKYSSTGVASLEVPDGGSVALSWQGQSSQAKPRVAPPHRATSSPSPTPSTRPSSPAHPSSGPGQSPSSSVPGSSVPTTSASSGTPTRTAGSGRSGKPGHARSSESGQTHATSSLGADETRAAVRRSAEVVSDAGGSDSGGLPGWVAPVVVVALFAGAGAVALVRRRGSGGP